MSKLISQPRSVIPACDVPDLTKLGEIAEAVKNEPTVEAMHQKALSLTAQIAVPAK